MATIGFFIFSGSSNRVLAEKIARYMDHKCGGVSLGNAKVKRFSDGECEVEIKENVRKREVFVIQSTCPPETDRYLVELLLMIDALKRASAAKITAVLPYYGYARQDKKVEPRVPISAKLVAMLLTKAGANRIITMDLHSGQTQGFFEIPVDHLYAKPVLLGWIRSLGRRRLVIVSPDAGGVERARAYAKPLGAELAIIDKRRSAPNEAKAMNVIGVVKGRTAVIVDDMVDTAGTLNEAAEALATRGAKEIYACAPHPVLSGPAIKRIGDSPIKALAVTDTIPLGEEAKACGKIVYLSVAELFGDAIIASYYGNSVNSLFKV